MPHSSFVNYVVEDLLSDLGPVQARAMFGGYGIYYENKIFAIIVDDRLYFKVSDSNRKDYEKTESQPFTYTAKNKKRVAMSYWEVPGDVLDDKLEILDWAKKSIHIQNQPKSAKNRKKS